LFPQITEKFGVKKDSNGIHVICTQAIESPLGDSLEKQNTDSGKNAGTVWHFTESMPLLQGQYAGITESGLPIEAK